MKLDETADSVNTLVTTLQQLVSIVYLMLVLDFVATALRTLI